MSRAFIGLTELLKEQTCRCKKWDLHNIIREQDEDEDDEDYDSEDDYESEYLDESQHTIQCISTPKFNFWLTFGKTS